MNLDQIATKCFILALFIRDDGQRLLLGDGYYDFNQKLQHFQGNTIANDVVEIQGDNGQLLAGQVMRSGAQKFEGYIGDATTSRQIIEQKRSDFMAFFRIKHFYKVIYIFPDGTAIQRQRGYLTDAPTIPEIFQKFPEYSIALNFEDANYYEYAEDEFGDEIYAHIIELALSGNVTGGLVWDAIGAVSNGISWSGIQTAQGEYIQITNELSLEAPLASVEMLGKAEQTTYSGKNLMPLEPYRFGYYYGTAVGTQVEYDVTSAASQVSFTPRADGTSTMAVTASWRGTYFMSQALTAGTYYLNLNGATTTGNLGASVYVMDSDHKITRQILNTTAAPITNQLQMAITLAEGETYISVGIGVRTTAGTITLGTLMISSGSTATDYEPYVGGTASPNPEFPMPISVVTGENVVKITGKNLLPIASTTRTNTRMGITITLADDGLITLNGTATGNLWPDLIYGIQANTTMHSECYEYYAQSDVVFSAKVVGGTKTTSAGGITVAYNDTETQATIPFSDMTQQKTTSATNGINRAYIYISNGSVFNNYSFYLQVEAGGSATQFEPYKAQELKVNLGKNLELAKIGNYQDRIYKDDGKWYIEKQVGKVVLDGTETWTTASTNISGRVRTRTTAIASLVKRPTSGNVAGDAISDHFVIATSGRNWEGDQSFCIETNGNMSFYADGTQTQSVSNWTTWLSTHPTTVYYALATPTTTEITNEALIAQLDALESASLYVGTNNIGTETQNAVPTLKIEYYTEVDLDGAGYEWEPGGNTAKTIVTVAGVDSAWPIWKVQGGAQNPTLTNITTGQTITWQGFVPEGQTLTINMAEMTADLAGANVFEYITGEWIRLAPGNNTLVYTAGSADKPSTLSWNGVLA